MSQATSHCSNRSANPALFQVEGTTVHPGATTAGPWDPTLQHGGAPAALIAWLATRDQDRADLALSRLTLDFVRPVPLEPLTFEMCHVREGRRTRVSQIILRGRRGEVVRATVLAMAEQPLEMSAEPGLEHGLQLATARALTAPTRTPSAFLEGVSMRIARGDPVADGPKSIWYHLERQVIADEATTPWMRAAATADFTNGTAAPLDPQIWSYGNADLTLDLVRAPRGEWILCDAAPALLSHGRGIAWARLADEHGYFGTACQSLLIARR